MRTYRIEYIARESQPEGWTVFVDALPVIVVDSPKEAVALAVEMAERDWIANACPTAVVAQPGGAQPLIHVQEFGAVVERSESVEG